MANGLEELIAALSVVAIAVFTLVWQRRRKSK